MLFAIAEQLGVLAYILSVIQPNARKPPDGGHAHPLRPLRPGLNSGTGYGRQIPHRHHGQRHRRRHQQLLHPHGTNQTNVDHETGHKRGQLHVPSVGGEPHV